MDSQPTALLRRLNPFCAQALEAAAQAKIQPDHWLLNLLQQRARGILSNSLTRDTNEAGEVSFTFRLNHGSCTRYLKGFNHEQNGHSLLQPQP